MIQWLIQKFQQLRGSLDSTEKTSFRPVKEGATIGCWEQTGLNRWYRKNLITGKSVVCVEEVISEGNNYRVHFLGESELFGRNTFERAIDDATKVALLRGYKISEEPYKPPPKRKPIRKSRFEREDVL